MTVKDINLKGKKVIVRCDFNVPLDDNLNITDDMRIVASIPTIKYILAQDPAKVILMSHLGRPKGQVSEKERLTPVAKQLEKLLNQKVLKLDDCIGDSVKASINNSSEKVILLENLRFYKQEEKNDPEFSKKLADLADIYVNDAFGTAHRAHASTEGIAKFLPAVAGFLLEKEINYLGKAVHNPEKPFVVIMGGAKVSDKIMLIENLMNKADAILIGGAMVFTFFKALGANVGTSRLEADKVDIAKGLLEKAKQKGVKIELGEDFVVATSFDDPKDRKVVTKIEDGWMGLDIGPKTVEIFKQVLSTAKTVVWNGPMGVFEKDEYAGGTKAIADYLANLKDCTTIVGGGDSAAAAKKFNVEDKMTHISTGGGASLEFLEGQELPGIAALKNRASSK